MNIYFDNENKVFLNLHQRNSKQLVIFWSLILNLQEKLA